MTRSTKLRSRSAVVGVMIVAVSAVAYFVYDIQREKPDRNPPASIEDVADVGDDTAGISPVTDPDGNSDSEPDFYPDTDDLPIMSMFVGPSGDAAIPPDDVVFIPGMFGDGGCAEGGAECLRQCAVDQSVEITSEGWPSELPIARYSGDLPSGEPILAVAPALGRCINTEISLGLAPKSYPIRSLIPGRVVSIRDGTRRYGGNTYPNWSVTIMYGRNFTLTYQHVSVPDPALMEKKNPIVEAGEVIGIYDPEFGVSEWRGPATKWEIKVSIIEDGRAYDVNPLAYFDERSQEFLASLLALGCFPFQRPLEVSGKKISERNLERPCLGYAVPASVEGSAWKIVIDALNG